MGVDYPVDEAGETGFAMAIVDSRRTKDFYDAEAAENQNYLVFVLEHGHGEARLSELGIFDAVEESEILSENRVACHVGIEGIAEKLVLVVAGAEDSRLQRLGRLRRLVEEEFG